jgi:hypothetical protein
MNRTSRIERDLHVVSAKRKARGQDVIPGKLRKSKGEGSGYGEMWVAQTTWESFPSLARRANIMVEDRASTGEVHNG